MELHLPADLDIQLTPRAEALVIDGEARVEEVASSLASPLLGYVPGDFRLVHAALGWLRDRPGVGERFCEWGCGIGVVTALAEEVGFEASGIEIQPELVEAGRLYLEEHGIEAEILEGSFIPDDFDGELLVPAGERVTNLDGAGARDEVDVEVEEFDVIYAFPWPGEEDLYFELFERFAAPGAHLLTYHGPVEGLRLRRRD